MFMIIIPIIANINWCFAYLKASLYLYSAHTYEEEYIINNPINIRSIVDMKSNVRYFFIISPI